MMEIKYCKDYRQNYLIIKINQKGSNESYSCKMITSNRIKGLLACSIKYINGEELLYYDISSKQSLAGIYENQVMSLENIKDILLGLKVLLDTLYKYLLEGTCIVLRPEYIFTEIGTGEYSYLFYPCCEEDDSSIQNLTEFFLNKVNADDREAVDFVYRLYELSQRDQFAIDEILLWFEQDVNTEYSYDGAEKVSEEQSAEQNTMFINFNENQKDPCEEKYINIESDRHKEINSKILFFCRKYYRPACVSAAAGIAGGAVLYYISLKYLLSSEEMLYLYTGFILLGILIFICLVIILYGKKTKYKINETDQKMEDSDNMEDGYSLVKEQETNYSVSFDTYEKMPTLRRQKKELNGETIFMPFTEACENKLYGMNAGNKYHIDLKELPLTVGKLSGHVTMVLEDQSISRMHARFSRESGTICLTDLNSTNGTFKNGLRLEPNATVRIEMGDEIKLGKLKFIYR